MKTKKKLLITIVLNLLITGAQFAGGLISGSTALLSDAVHNLSDIISLLTSYVAVWLSGKKANNNRTFGYKRAEILAAFVNATGLIVIAVFLIIEASKQILKPDLIQPEWVIWLAMLSILMNGASVLILHNDSKHSLNIKSSYLHLFTDMITSFAVLAAGIIMYFFEVYSLDGYLTIFIAVYLIYSTWKILVKSLSVLMQFSPGEIELKSINSDITQIDAVNNIHHVHIWQLDEHQIHFEAHVDIQPGLNLHEIQKVFSEIRRILASKYNIYHVTLEPESQHCKDQKLIAE